MACSINKRKIELDVSNGEFLEFTVKANAAAPVYGIDIDDVPILRPPGKNVRWPQSGKKVPARAYTAVFSVLFVGTTKCDYKVVAKKNTGDVVVKDCSWSASDGVTPKPSFEVTVI